jgi:hypothetical protein
MLAQLPTLTDRGVLAFLWEVAGIFPSGNSVFEVPLAGCLAGRVTTGDGFFCYR